jgi:hypothetical protein
VKRLTYAKEIIAATLGGKKIASQQPQDKAAIKETKNLKLIEDNRPKTQMQVTPEPLPSVVKQSWGAALSNLKPLTAAGT